MILAALDAAKEPHSLQGVANFLHRCVQALDPVVITASTSETFDYVERPGRDASAAQISLESMNAQDILDFVVLPLCRQVSLPLSLRMGTCRGVNPALGLAGDGLGPANLSALARLCRKNDRVKFLFTVLSRGDQHEAAALASRFRNLHLWGCWWYCNNASVVSEVTALRLEMLGTGFTFQASSARVHDQLIGKWIHARAILKEVLAVKYRSLLACGWAVSRGDIRRDVHRLLGGAFEEFLAKKL